jgi:hypothetical protein
MKNLTLFKLVSAFLLCVLLITSCTNNAHVGDALITCYPKESEIHISVKYPGHYEFSELTDEVFVKLKEITYSNETEVRLFICHEEKDRYGKLSYGEWEYVKSFSAVEAKKYVSSKDWNRYNSLRP